MKNNGLVVAGIFSLVFLFFCACSDGNITPAFLEITKEDMQRATIDASSLSYLNLDSYQMEAVKSHRFQDVRITLNNEDRGVYSLPCKIPLLGNGDANIGIIPVMRLNGTTYMMADYPFFFSFNTSVKLTPDKDTRLENTQITFKYDTLLRFPLLVTFESSTEFTRVDEDDLVYTDAEKGGRFKIVNDANKGKIGRIELTDEVSEFDLISSNIKFPSTSGDYILLEIDYRSDIEFSTLVKMTTSSYGDVSTALVNVLPSGNEWKKIYINLSPTINTYHKSGLLDYARIQLQGSKLSEDADGNPIHNATVEMDNIKVVCSGY
ncbi:MAG: hypothetical protein LBR51_04140 [Bacteroidales bacterium]|jgi:hypothetical protein|nr:hypothetical protein [Bacteroidales bacterium]